MTMPKEVPMEQEETEKTVPAHLAPHMPAPMKAYADEEMMRRALGDTYEEMARPPQVVLQSDHPLCAAVVSALCDVFDPEIPVNIYELGLVYAVGFAQGQAGADVQIRMTLTSPACPVAQEMPSMVQAEGFKVPGVADVEVDIIWDPPWNPSMMAETAKMQLNMFT